MSETAADVRVADWIETAMATATTAETVIIVTEGTQANLRWADNSLTTNGQMHTRKATVVAIAEVDGGLASASLNGPVRCVDDLVALVRLAGESASDSPADDDAQRLPSGSIDADFADAAELTSIAVFADVALGLGRAFDAARRSGIKLFGFAEYLLDTVWLATSAGVRRRHVQPSGRLELNAKHADMIGSAWVGQATTSFSDVDVDAHYAEVSRRLRWCENRLELPAGRYETILPSGAVADLLIYAYWTMSGRDAAEGRNVYAGKERGATRVGERLSPLPLRMWSDPSAEHLPGVPFAIVREAESGLTAVHDNGADVGAVDWISDGSLTSLIWTRGKHDLAFPTQNLLVDAGGTASLDDMIASTKRGLLLTCLWYIREVDPETLLLTGLTRDGVYLVEDGEVKGMVNNFRFNESPVDLLHRISEAGASERSLCREWNDYFLYTQVPPVRVPDFHMSTVSQAY